jgi:hypothetical protein
MKAQLSRDASPLVNVETGTAVMLMRQALREISCELTIGQQCGLPNDMIAIAASLIVATPHWVVAELTLRCGIPRGSAIAHNT